MVKSIDLWRLVFGLLVAVGKTKNRQYALVYWRQLLFALEVNKTEREIRGMLIKKIKERKKKMNELN